MLDRLLHKRISVLPINIQCCTTTLWLTLEKAGFKFATLAKRRTIMETPSLQNLRYDYLLAVIKYIEKGRHIFRRNTS